MGEGEPLDRRRSGASRQLTLDIGRAPSYDIDDFLESPANVQALTTITRWPDWPRRALLLVGPSGCGKSHLGAIWAAQAEAHIVRPGEVLAPQDWPVSAALIEDCDHAGYDEAAFFHTLNRAEEESGWLLLTARTPPTLWGLRTRDLESRLRLAPSITIGRPDPALMQAVLVKLFADRQIRIDAEVVAYAARHCEQSLEAVGKFVAAVDVESLAAGRRITRPLAAAALARASADGVRSDEDQEPDRQGPT